MLDLDQARLSKLLKRPPLAGPADASPLQCSSAQWHVFGEIGAVEQIERHAISQT
jgi:hypothetical protein